MNTKEQLEAQIKELENKLLEMKAAIDGMKEEKKSFNRWRAEEGKLYYFLNSHGGVESDYDRSYYDNNRYIIGNYYETEEEAERARDLQLAIVRVNDAIIEANEGWVADYNNDDDRYIIVYDNNINKYMTGYRRSINYSYKLKECKTREITERIIADCREDLNLIFNIK